MRLSTVYLVSQVSESNCECQWESLDHNGAHAAPLNAKVGTVLWPESFCEPATAHTFQTHRLVTWHIAWDGPVVSGTMSVRRTARVVVAETHVLTCLV